MNEQSDIFEKINGFAGCRHCKKTHVYNPNSSTSHLRRHFYTINQNQRSATSSLKQLTTEQSLTVHKNLTTAQPTTIKDLIASWICTDICLISVIEDDGLKLFIQECTGLGIYFVSFILSSYLCLGSLYGKINVDNILRGRTTISNHTYQLADGCRQQLKSLLLEPYESGCLSISPDFWSISISIAKYHTLAFLLL